MTKKSSRIGLMSVLLILVMCFAAVIAGVSVGKTADAATEATFTKELEIAHLTDTHYYPLRWCSNTDEFYAYVAEKSTKQWMESEILFRASVAQILEEKPDYLVVTGDIAQDGERQGHIDVANTLRKLQNEVRAAGEEYEHFQVFVVFGNHCLYNPDVFSFASGTKVATDFVTRKDVSVIYSSLGFPDITDDEAREFYAPEEYDAGEYSFVNSTIADGVDIKWQFEGREAQSDYDNGYLTYIANTATGYTFVGLDVPQSNPIEGHVLGGELFKSTKAWLTANAEFVANDYSIGLAHHSIVEHNPVEEEITTGFILYNPIESADFLADFGMRYVFTGHVHSNDVASYISFNGNQITDIETASSGSIGTAVRTTTIKDGTQNGKVIQDALTRLNYNVRVDMSKAIDGGYMSQGYLTRNKLTGFFDGKVCTDYSAYAEQKIYLMAVENYLSLFLDAEYLADLVGGILDKVDADGFIGQIVSDLKPSVRNLILNLIDEINVKILKDYTYSGTNPACMGSDNKVFGYVEEMLYRVLDYKITDNLTFIEFFFNCYLGTCYGGEAPTLEALDADHQEAMRQVASGKILSVLVDELLDKERGLYFLLDGLLSTELDIARDDTAIRDSILSVGQIMLGFDIDLNKLTLNDVIPKALDSDMVKTFFTFDLEGKTVMEYLDDVLTKYKTESLISNLSELVYDIAYAFLIDPTPDGTAVDGMIYVEEGSTHTYESGLAEKRAAVATVENGKLPSMLTVTYGANSSTMKNFVYFTDARVDDTVVQYAKVSDGAFDASKAAEDTGESKIVSFTKPLIDVGLWSQLGYGEIRRHEINLNGLVANTEYYYRVGSKEKGWFSEVFTFKTAPDNDTTPFEVLLISDLQSFVDSSYDDMKSIFNKMDTVFDDGYDFVINAGDTVDNSRNMTQFKNFLNVLSGVWGNTTQVVATGNHEKYTFSYEEKNETVYSELDTSEYNYLNLHYNFNLPTQDTVKNGGAYYSFDYSGVHFAVLNTNDIDEANKMSTKQIEWLEADLKNTTKKHKVIVMHKSLYSSGSHTEDAEIVEMRKQLGVIFEKYGVHLVIAGHDHTYSETYYLDSNGKVVENAANGEYMIGDQGVLYVTLGTLGNKFYSYVENDDIPVYYGKEIHNPTLSDPTFAKLYFDGENLYYRGYQYDYETDTITELVPKSKLDTLGLILVAAVSVVIVLSLAVVLSCISRKKK